MPAAGSDRTYSTPEVCAMLKISSRQLLHLADRGIAEPAAPDEQRTGSGYPLRWTAEEVAHLARPIELARLLRSPLTAHLIRFAFECNRADFEKIILLLRRNQPADPTSGTEQTQ